MTAEAAIALFQAAIEAIDAIITSVKNAKAGTVDPATATAAISALTQALATNNQAADSALDSKFPNG